MAAKGMLTWSAAGFMRASAGDVLDVEYPSPSCIVYDYTTQYRT